MGTVQPWVTGPNFIFVEFVVAEPEYEGEGAGAGANGNKKAFADAQQGAAGMAAPGGSAGIFYLGTTTHCPKPELERAWRPIPSSYRGLTQHSEHAFMGESGSIYMALSRWDESVYSLCASFAGMASRGSFDGSAIGGLLMAQAVGIRVHILFPYTNFGYKSMPKGYRYLDCVLVHDDLLTEGGAEGRVLGLAWRAHAVYNQAEDIWNVYDQSVTTPKPPM